MATINSGLTMRLMPRRVLTFTNLQASLSQQITVAEHIDVSVFTEATLLVRAHTGTFPGSTSKVTVVASADGFTLEDPTASFSTSSEALGTAFGSTAFGPGATPAVTTFPAYAVVALNKPFGRYLSVSITALQDGTPGTFTVALSIDLDLKGGDPSAMPMSYNTFRGYRI